MAEGEVQKLTVDGLVALDCHPEGLPIVLSAACHRGWPCYVSFHDGDMTLWCAHPSHGMPSRQKAAIIRLAPLEAGLEAEEVPCAE